MLKLKRTPIKEGEVYTILLDINCCFLKGDRVEILKIDDDRGEALLKNIDGDTRISDAYINCMRPTRTQADIDTCRHISTEWIEILIVEVAITKQGI
jgi:hypothetical protein